MKKMLQNAQMRDFIGATFCLVMTFALFLMYTGCTFVMAGGAAEETSVEAAYDAPNDTSEKDSVKLALYDNVRLAGRVRSVEQPANSAPMSSTSMASSEGNKLPSTCKAMPAGTWIVRMLGRTLPSSSPWYN